MESENESETESETDESDTESKTESDTPESAEFADNVEVADVRSANNLNSKRNDQGGATVRKSRIAIKQRFDEVRDRSNYCT